MIETWWPIHAQLKWSINSSRNYIDVIMTPMASQITGLTVVHSTVYSDADQRKHQSSASLAFVWGIHRDREIPRTKGRLRGKCFHLMTSSCNDARPSDPVLSILIVGTKFNEIWFQIRKFLFKKTHLKCYLQNTVHILCVLKAFL